MKSYLLVIISLLCINMAVAQDDSLLIQKRLFQPRIYWDYGQTLMLWQERYQTEGRFYRLGLGYLAYLDDVNRLGLGVRFAESSFKDEGVIFINSKTINSPMRDDFKRSDLQATWIEIVLNSEKQLRLKKDVPSSYWNKFFSIGIMIRYKMLLDYPSYQPIEVFSIPGYGRLINKRNLGFNLFLKINI